MTANRRSTYEAALKGQPVKLIIWSRRIDEESFTFNIMPSSGQINTRNLPEHFTADFCPNSDQAQISPAFDGLVIKKVKGG